jgi:WD40 repeat protein
VDLDWNNGRSAEGVRVPFAEDDRVDVAVSAGVVRLTTLDGTTYTVTPAGGRTGASGLDFAAERARARPCLARGRLLAAVERLEDDGAWIVLSGTAGIGKTVVACAAADRLEAAGRIVVQHFYGARPDCDDIATVVASLEGQLLSAIPDLPRPDRAGSPLSRWERMLHAAADRSARIVVLLDGVPDLDEEDGEIPVVALPRRTSAVVTTRAGFSVQYAVGDGGHVEVLHVDGDGDTDVCEAMLRRHAAALQAAFGSVPQPPGADTADVPLARELVGLSGAVPGRLAAIIEWLLDQPIAGAHLDRIPWLLTVRMDEVWRRLRIGADNLGLALVAVAHPGFTVGDARRPLTLDGRLDLAADLALAAEVGLVTIGGALEDESSTLTPHPLLPAAIEQRFSREMLLAAHGVLLAAAADDIVAASSYAIDHAVRHGLGCHDIDAVLRLVGSGEFLHRRAVTGGVAGFLADVRAVVAAAGPDPGLDVLLTALERCAAVASPRPERLLELVAVELHRIGVPDGLQYLVADPWTHDATEIRMSLDLDGGSTDHLLPRTVAATRLSTGELVLADADGVLRSGDARLTGPLGPVSALAGADAHVAAATGSEVRLVEVRSARELARFDVDAPITALCLPRDDLVVAGRSSGTVAVVETPTGTTRLLVGHGGAVTGIVTPATDDRGGHVVTASTDGTVRVWDTASGRQLLVVDHSAPVTHLIPVPGRPDIVSADAAGTVRWWSADTGAPQRVLGGHDGPVSALAAGEGFLYTAGADGRVRCVELAGNDVGTDVSTGPVVRRMLVVDGGDVVLWQDDGQLVRRDRSGAQLVTFRPEVEPPVLALVADREERVLVVHGDGATVIPSAPVDPGMERHLGIAGSGDICAVTPAGTVLLTTSGDVALIDAPAAAGVGFVEPPDGRMLIGHATGLELTTGALPKGTVPDRRHVHLLATDGRAAAAAFADGGVEVVVPGIAEPAPAAAAARAVPPVRVRRPTALAVAGPQSLVIGESTGVVQRVLDGAVRRRRTGDAPVTVLSVQGRWIYAGTADGRVLRWDADADRLDEIGVHDAAVTGLAVLGTRLASSSEDRTVRVWDLDPAAEIAIHPFPAPVRALAAAGGTVPVLIARTGSDRVTRLEMSFAPAVDPVVRPRVVEARAEDADPPPADQIEFVLDEPCELRALRVAGGDADQEAGPIRRAVLLASDGRSGPALSLTADGRLHPPVRIHGGRDLVVRAGIGRPVPLEARLELVVITPARRAEHTLTLPLDRTEPA